jgi:hypothetical protein
MKDDKKTNRQKEKRTLTEDNKKEGTENQDFDTLIASFYSLLSNASSLVIHQSFKSLFTYSSHVSLVVIWLSSHYRIVLLSHYEPMPPSVSVGYVQTISNDVARGSPRLVPPPVSRVCHRSGSDLFLCCHKSIVAYASQLRLIVGHITF